MSALLNPSLISISDLYSNNYFIGLYNKKFIDACCQNDLLTAKHLFETKQNIDIRFNNDQAFISACKSDNIEVASYLESLLSSFYNLEIENEHIIKYSINKFPFFDKISVVIDKCCICYETNSNIITECTHQFCYDCLSMWYDKSKRCPYCRFQFTFCNKI